MPFIYSEKRKNMKDFFNYKYVFN